MRLKITQLLAGSIDGLHLDRFAVGGVYDIGTSLANYLLAMGAAEPAPGEQPAHDGSIDHEVLNERRQRLSSGDPAGQGNAADRWRRTTKRR